MRISLTKSIFCLFAAALFFCNCTKKNSLNTDTTASGPEKSGKLSLFTITPPLPGGPGYHKMFFGSTSGGDGSATIEAYEQALFGTASGSKMFSLLRMYNPSPAGHPVSPQFLLQSGYRTSAENARDKGRIPIMNFGISSYPIEQIATDLYNPASQVYADMMSNINWFKTAFTGTHYAWITFCHEPNDDFNNDTQGAIAYPSSPASITPAMRQAYYRHAFRKIYLMLKANNVTNVLLWSPAYLCAPNFPTAGRATTYNGDGSINNLGISAFNWVHPHFIGTTLDPNGHVIEDQTIPRRGTTRWAASSVRFIDGEAIDYYNPTVGPGPSAINKTWASIWDNWTDALTNGPSVATEGPQTQDFPRAIFELGTFITTDTSVTTVQLFHQQMIDIGTNNGLVGVAAWNRGGSEVTVAQASSATPNDKVKGVKYVANNLTRCNMAVTP